MKVTHVWESIVAIREKMVNASSLIHDSVTDGLAYCLDMKKQFVYYDPLISKRQPVSACHPG